MENEIRRIAIELLEDLHWFSDRRPTEVDIQDAINALKKALHLLTKKPKM